MLVLNLDFQSIEDGVYKFTQQMQQRVEAAAELLTAMTHEFIRSKAQTELKSRKDQYLEALLDPEEMYNGVWAITLQKSGLWIEDGMKPYSMIDAMLKNPKAKIGKHGKYMVVPFTHTDSSAPASIKTSNSLTTVLQNRAKAEMRKNSIPLKKLQRDATGKPILGLVDNIKKPSKETQGMLDYIQKNSFFYKKGKSPSNIGTHLDNMKIYQNEMKDKEGNIMMDKHGMARMNKSAKTFRVISESQRGTGLWEHPGLKAVNFFESAIQWAEQEWETTVKPDLLQKLMLP